MGNHVGRDGTVKVGNNAIAEIVSFSANETADTTEDSVLGDTWRSRKTTMKSWDATVTVYWDETDTTGQGALDIGAEVTLNMYPEGAATGATYLTGTGIVTSRRTNVELEGIVGLEIQVVGNGALTETTVPA